MARLPSGKAAVCKTAMHRFKSGPRLTFFFLITSNLFTRKGKDLGLYGKRKKDTNEAPLKLVPEIRIKEVLGLRLAVSSPGRSRTKAKILSISGEWWNGIHEGLKILWSKGLEGSIPSLPTSSFQCQKNIFIRMGKCFSVMKGNGCINEAPSELMLFKGCRKDFSCRFGCYKIYFLKFLSGPVLLSGGCRLAGLGSRFSDKV